MPAIDTALTRPAVSVIVPARNEEATLGGCLLSLVSQRGVTFEIIVIDDHSTDRTRAVAGCFEALGVRIIEAGPLPAGWTGKNGAVAAGANAATGQWLLFTDADTIHVPGSMLSSLEEAEQRGASMLSYSPRQIVKTFWEKAVMPVIFAELAATYPPAQVSNPKSTAAAANGQYILITREAYDAAGGHAAVATCLLEDVALAHAVKRSGRRIFFRYGADAVRTRMYRSFDQLREGWTKNLALLFPSPLRLAALRAGECLLIIAGFLLAVGSAMRHHWQLAVIAVALTSILYNFLLRRIARAHFPWDANLLAAFGLAAFSYLLLLSARAHANGSVLWKGRTYSDDACPQTTGH